MSVTKLILTQLHYRAWANAELHESLQAVSAEAHPQELHTIIRVLNHAHVVDRIFEAHLQRRPHGYEAVNTKETPSAAELGQAVKALDAWYLGYAETLTQAELDEPIAFTFTDGKPGRMTRSEMLLHVTSHSAYHRGQVSRLLIAISAAPPRDGLATFLHLSGVRA
jgi:uncharacterized damage-inducible protein DinB